MISSIIAFPSRVIMNCSRWLLFLPLVWFLVFDCVLSSCHYSMYAYGPSIVKRQTTCPQEFYSVVFDAGSTGSRVSVFQFRIGKKGTMIKLNKEFFLSTEPGISSYVHNVSGISESLKGLLDHATKNVPKTFHPRTQLIFKATAGLRLLPDEDADNIMAEVRSFFGQSTFNIPDINEIEVMGGGEEGLFGWLTANFLLRTLWKEQKEETAITIDLGGGSVQITFVLPSTDDITSRCSQEIGKAYKILLLKSSFNVFTHSALGNGLKAGFLNIMGGDEEFDKNIKNDKESLNSWHSELSSPCFVPSFNSTWRHGRFTYNIKGENPEVSRLVDCQQEVDQFVESSTLSAVLKGNHQDIYLFSYFFDVARWAGLVSKDTHMIEITRVDYQNAARYYCDDDTFTDDKPFTCMALLYIDSLLGKGFGIAEDKTLHVGTEIKGKQLSWTLGIALATIHDHFSYSSLCDYS